MVNRVQYIDAMRGLAMFLVVFVHVEGFCFFDFGYISFLGSLISLVHLPLFFFISGLFAFNLSQPTREQFVNKVYTLLIPMCFIGLIYTYFILNRDATFFITDTAKAGYWFTLVLFQMYVIYYIIKYLTYKFFLGCENKIIYVLIILSIVMYLGKYPMRKIDVLNVIGTISSLHYTMNYFQFFVLGIFVAQYKNKLSTIFSEIIETYYVRILFVLAFIVGGFYKYYFLDKGSIYVGGIDKIFSMLIGTFCSYCGVMSIFLIFRKYQKYFTETFNFGFILKSIGSRTLDIYLLHYFFLFLIPLSEYSSLLNSLLTEIPTVGILAFFVIGCSLLLSVFIRKNVFLSRFLFGIK